MDIPANSLCDNAPMAKRRYADGLSSARLLMVLSSLSPLFVLWAIRGNDLIRDRWFVSACVALAVLPTAALWVRIKTARNAGEKRLLHVGSVESRRNDVLAYLFALMLPFYPSNLDGWREFAATLVALGLVIHLFWRLNLHYMNLWFAVFHYNVVAVIPPSSDNPYSGRDEIVLITHRHTVHAGELIYAYRLSDTVRIEVESG